MPFTSRTATERPTEACHVRRRLLRVGGLLVVAFLAGCAHSGVGTGILEAPETEGNADEGTVEFVWTSGADSSSGNIGAKTADGRVFRGTFIQLTSSGWYNSYSPYYSLWMSPWGMWGPWWSGPQSSFVRNYSGKVLAHLVSPDGARMRCEIIVRRPTMGLDGGGEGDCQLSDRSSVFGVTFGPGHRGLSELP